MGIRKNVKAKITDPQLRESPCLDTAIVEWMEYGPCTATGEPPVAWIEDRLQELHSENATPERKPGREERRAQATELITDAEVMRAIAPEVEQLRKGSRSPFKSSEPPFTTVAEAAEWIEQQSAADFEQNKDTQAAQALEKIESLKQEYGPLEEVQLKSVELPYHKPGDDHQETVITSPHTYLRVLARKTRRIASCTGLYQSSLVMHVLTGFEPVRRRVSIRTNESAYAPYPGGPQLRTNHVQVSFYVRDLTEKQLRDIYNSARVHITGLNRKAHLEESQARIYDLVEKYGGLCRTDWKHGSKKRLLEAVLEDAQKEGLTHSRGVYSTTRGIEEAYKRARKRLEPPT